MKFTLKKEPLAPFLIVGSIGAILGNALHPRSPEEKMADPEITAHLMQHHTDQWLFAHVLLLVVVPILAIGFVGLFRFLYPKEKNWSLIGLVLVSLWAILSLFVFMMDGLAGLLYANMPSGVFEYNYFFGLIITVVSFILYGPGIVMFSISAMKAKQFSPWLNWLGIGVGAFVVPAYALGLFGTYMVYSPLFPVYAAVATLWGLLIGVQLLNKK